LDQLDAYFSEVDARQGPVNVDQIADSMERIRELPSEPVRTRQRPRVWIAAVAAAAVITAIGVVPLLVGPRVADAPPASEPSTITTPTTLETAPPTTGASEVHAPVWTGPIDPITLTLDPPLVPAEIGVVEVTVTGNAHDDVWVMVCSGARGVIDPAGWPQTDQIPLGVCGDASRQDGTLLNPEIEDGRFEAVLQVPIDAQAIEDGGIVITAGDIWVPLRGNALLSIADADMVGTTAAPPTTTVIPAETWNPILAATRAEAAPAAATCPAGTDPTVPGPVDQDRPDPRWVGNLAGAFDQHTGQVVYVDVTGETWLFDVCTNTWRRADPEWAPYPADQIYDAAGEPSAVRGHLVYDVDSDVTVALRYNGPAVYDAAANTWTRHPYGTGDEDFFPLGAVYDPVSGLIITSTLDHDDGEVWNLWAYDVDTDAWTEIGPVTIERDTPCCTQIDLLGYAAPIDRLILTTYQGDRPVTLLVDPRNGETTIIPDENAPVVDLGWPGASYGQTTGTVYVDTQRPRALCGFDAQVPGWACQEIPSDLPSVYDPWATIVEDAINNRLLLIPGTVGTIPGWASDKSDDFWSLDLATGTWALALPPASP